MDISNSKNTNIGNIDSRGGNVHLGDNYYKSVEYKELQKTITRLEKLVQLAQNAKEKEEYYQELEDEKRKLEEFKVGVISLAETFQKIEIDTDRLESAKRFFDEGKFKEARAVLDTEKIRSDQKKLLQRKLELEKRSDENNEDLKNNSDEYLVLAKLTAIDFNQVDRFGKTIEYFEFSLKSNRNTENIFSYAHFLQKHNQNNRATPLYEEALAIYRKLAEVNPQTYLPDVGMTQINMSIFYQESKINKELSIQLVDEAVTNLLPFSQIPYIQNYLGVAFNVLKDWDVDVKEFLEKKTAANNG